MRKMEVCGMEVENGMHFTIHQIHSKIQDPSPKYYLLPQSLTCTVLENRKTDMRYHLLITALLTSILLLTTESVCAFSRLDQKAVIATQQENIIQHFQGGTDASFENILDDSTTSEKEYKNAVFRTVLTISAASIFGLTLTATRGVTSGYEFFAGYLIEQSLSIDNLFVFIMLFDYFNVPDHLQNRVLSWGIWGAIILRGMMISVGVAALQKFRSIILVFAGILIASSVNLLLEGNTDDKDIDHDNNMIMKLTKIIFPNTSDELHGEDFFTTCAKTGKKIATPLFLCLVCVELSDFVFAVDSIPAVLGVSKDPLIVYASNVFAILALRSLYTVVAKAVSSFHCLKPAVALVLLFVGSKMVGEYFHFELGIGVSLSIICTCLGGGILASIFESKNKDKN